jgi:transcriptional regulator with XRE-family HTH domain
MADVTIEKLAQAAGVTKRTVHRLETSGTIHVADKLRHVSREVWRKITTALAAHAVELLPEVEDRGAGVRWTRSRSSRQSS